MAWTRDGVKCDTCVALYEMEGIPRVLLVQRARAKGWHLYRGPSMTGKDLEVSLCPDCIGSPRPIPKKKGPMEDDQPLIDVATPEATARTVTPP